MILTVIAGLAGGILRSIIGYLEKEDVKFDFKKFLNSLIRATLAGIGMSLGLGVIVLDIQTFLVVMFAAAGVDTVLHEGYKVYTKNSEK